MMEMTGTQAYRRALKTNDPDHWREAATLLFQEKQAKRKSGYKNKGKGIWPPPVVQTVFPEKTIRMSTYQHVKETEEDVLARARRTAEAISKLHGYGPILSQAIVRNGGVPYPEVV